MKKLFFIRHAETHMNVSGHFAGQIETSLTQEGKQQAHVAGNTVKATLPEIDIIICSPFERTRHTAEIIAGKIGYPVEKIIYNDLLVERGFGELEGTHSKEFFKTKEYADLDAVEGVETVKELQERAQKALEYLTSRIEDNVLVVSHGAFGRALKRAVNNLPHTHEYETFEPIGNAEILELI